MISYSLTFHCNLHQLTFRGEDPQPMPCPYYAFGSVTLPDDYVPGTTYDNWHATGPVSIGLDAFAWGLELPAGRVPCGYWWISMPKTHGAPSWGFASCSASSDANYTFVEVSSDYAYAEYAMSDVVATLWPHPTPEPSTVVLLAAAFVIAALFRRNYA